MPTLIKGMGGNFIVHLDGRLLFSKKSAGRFPEPGEIERLVAEQLPA